MHQSKQVQNRVPSRQEQTTEVDFDQWAKAVRQQMIAALKRRENNDG